MARPWPAPPASNTLQIIGDTHFGPNSTPPGLTTGRSSKVKDDVNGGALVPKNLHRIQVGDLVEDGGIHSPVGDDDTEAKNWCNSLTSQSFQVVIGNHDISNNSRTGAVAAAAFGLPGTWNWTRDVGFAKLIGVSPKDLLGTGSPADYTTIRLDGPVGISGSALNYLDAQLANATKDCIVFAHAPLEGTVLGDTAEEHASSAAAFSLDPDDEVRKILNDYPRAKCIISGHTHSTFGVTDWVKTELTEPGGRSIVAINASAVFYTGLTVEQISDPIKTMFLTWNPPNIEVRIRDHGNRCWTSVNGSMVTTRAIPA